MCNNNGLLIIPVSLTCFGKLFCPSSGALDCYSLWHNAPTILPAGHKICSLSGKYLYLEDVNIRATTRPRLG